MKVFDKFAALFLLGLAALRCVLLLCTPFDLAGDEAHYWEWSRRLDLAYYSKGPVVAYLIAGGTAIFGDTPFGVRFSALVSSTVFLCVFYLFVRFLFGARVSFLSLLVMAFALIFASQGLIMTTDPPTALFWLLSIIAVHFATLKHRKSAWIVLGPLVGLAVLSRYTALILYPSIVCFLLFTPKLRRELLLPHFWIGFILFLLFLTPVLVWNMQNDWVNVFHNASHFGSRKGYAFRPWYLGDLIGGQLGLVGPVVFPLMLLAFYKGYRRWRKEDDLLAGLFVCSSLPLLVVCVALSMFKRVYANWPMPVAIGGFLLLAYFLSQNHRDKTYKACLYSNLALSLLTYSMFLGLSLGVPGKYLPLKKLVGWEGLGEQVERVLSTGEFVIAGGYAEASAIAFYTKTHPLSLCDNGGGRRMNQYDVWNDWPKLKGQDALIVVKDTEQNQLLFDEFDSVKKLDKVYTVVFSGTRLREFSFYKGKNYSGRVPLKTERY